MSGRAIAVIALAVTGVIAEIGFVTELIRTRFVVDSVSTNYVTLTFATVVASLGVGVATARIDRWRGIGCLLVAGAAGAAVGYFRFSRHPWLSAAGFVIATATALLPLHAGVAHREGVPKWVRRLLIAAHVTLALCGVAMVTTASRGTIDRWFITAHPSRFGANPMLLVDAPDFARAMQVVSWFVILGTAAIAVGARFWRWRAAPRAVRRSSAPVVAGAAAWTLMMAGAGATMLLDRAIGARAVIADFGAVALPVLGLGVLAATVGWVELVRPRLGRVSAGTVELQQVQPADDAALRALLADVLATTKVDVALASGSGWVDAAGRPYVLHQDARRMTVVRQAGEPIAAIIHDPDVPFEAIELGARLAGAQLAAQRATALARSRGDAIRLATGELVRAGDRASAAISSLLAKGPLPALSDLSRGLRDDTCTLAQAAATLRETTTEVRGLSHGLFPRDLDDSGLDAVLSNEGTPKRRLASSVEMTCYLLAQDDVLAVFSDVGHDIVVRRSRPPDAELVERVEALGGSVEGTVATVPAELA